MGSLSGLFQRPVVAASIVALASVSTDLRDKFWPSKPDLSEQVGWNYDYIKNSRTAWARISDVSKIYDPKTPIPVPNFKYHNPALYMSFDVPSLPALHNVYKSANLSPFYRPINYAPTLPSTTSDDLIYTWHSPHHPSENSKTVVVLLGWLGAKQSHLKKYADWYASQGYNVITFTFPLSEILSYRVGGKIEENLNSLVNHLSDYLEDEYGENLVFHTFSNTGWLIYGSILEKFQTQDDTLLGRIKGCIVDSAPVADPGPQVWASGFSAAFWKRNSIAEGHRNQGDSNMKPAMSETALLMVLEKFFHLVLKLPSVNQRLSNVLEQLKSGQPNCPQLYIYSSADKVIPAGSVETFINGQEKEGRVVKSCNFKSTPHVEHFSHEPELYASQLSKFLKDCVSTS